MTRKYLLAAMTAGLLLGAAPMANAAGDAAPAPPKITSGVLKALSAAQTANNKKDYPAALSALEDAKKVSDRTPYDNLMINRFTMSVHVGMNDLDAADVDAEAAADTDPSVQATGPRPNVFLIVPGDRSGGSDRRHPGRRQSDQGGEKQQRRIQSVYTDVEFQVPGRDQGQRGNELVSAGRMIIP